MRVLLGLFAAALALDGPAHHAPGDGGVIAYAPGGEGEVIQVYFRPQRPGAGDTFDSANWFTDAALVDDAAPYEYPLDRLDALIAAGELTIPGEVELAIVVYREDGAAVDAKHAVSLVHEPPPPDDDPPPPPDENTPVDEDAPYLFAGPRHHELGNPDRPTFEFFFLRRPGHESAGWDGCRWIVRSTADYATDPNGAILAHVDEPPAGTDPTGTGWAMPRSLLDGLGPGRYRVECLPLDADVTLPDGEPRPAGYFAGSTEVIDAWRRGYEAGLAEGGGPVLPDLNTMSEAELLGLEGVGPVRAGAILQARPFQGWSDVDAVYGIGPATLALLQAQTRIGGTP